MRQISVVVLCLSGFLCACATVVKGTEQRITLDTPGYPGASCILTSEEIGSQEYTTPAVLRLPKSRHNISVQCKSGCATGLGIIESRFEEVSAGNIILGGVVGLGVDAATGAMNHYDPKNEITLRPDPACTS